MPSAYSLGLAPGGVVIFILPICVELLCELLIERRVNLPWTAFEGVRTEVVNPEFLRLPGRARHAAFILPAV